MLGVHAILVGDWEFVGGIEERGMEEKGGERGEQISLATIMKHHLITGLIMEWNSRTILFDFCPVYRYCSRD